MVHSIVLRGQMADIKEQKLLYHLTALDNLASILHSGLHPRANLRQFADVADAEIIDGRREQGLEKYVPFHWFARNPFDGRVQRDHPRKDFVLITVQRTLAARENWIVIPRHPLASSGVELLSYKAGIAAINWEVMNERDYHDSECKSICMAECLSPRPLAPADFFSIFAPTEAIAKIVRHTIKEKDLYIDVVVNSGMFLK
jgi:hypothetical protein